MQTGSTANKFKIALNGLIFIQLFDLNGDLQGTLISGQKFQYNEYNVHAYAMRGGGRWGSPIRVTVNGALNIKVLAYATSYIIRGKGGEVV